MIPTDLQNENDLLFNFRQFLNEYKDIPQGDFSNQRESDIKDLKALGVIQEQ